MRPIALLLAALLAGVCRAAAQAAADDHGTLVIVTGQQATLPIPTLIQSTANQDVADQLFLRLAGLGPTLHTVGDDGFVPLLARRWTRRDSLTLVFDLDPRARWQDGAPVTARDVVFTFERARNRSLTPKLAPLLRFITSVRAEGTRRVVFRFSRAYAGQMYDAAWQVQPLPSHLLERIPPDKLAESDFARHPVGNGPFTWVRLVPGEYVELAANARFFLGAPKLDRVFFHFASDGDARMNLLLSGAADALENVLPLSNVQRVQGDPNLRLVVVPSLVYGYLLFNERDPADRTQPHPILSDVAVRRALTMAIDREGLGRAVFGPYSAVPVGPVSQMLWIRDPTVAPLPYDTAEAHRLLAARGWLDHDGDGVLDRDGVPLALTLNVPGTSAVRRLLALQIQEQLRTFGVKVDVSSLAFEVYMQRRLAGDFDLDLAGATQDPSPSGLTEVWSCSGIGGGNVGGYCNPAVDSLFDAAIFATGDPLPLWQEAIRRISDDAPAVFLYALSTVAAVNRRFDNVHIRPESVWLQLREWSVVPGRQIARDRGAAAAASGP